MATPFIDRAILQADQLLRSFSGNGPPPRRASPAAALPPAASTDAELSAEERRHTAGLMRVNHTGEVCAQALYQGQALTARDPAVRRAMAGAAREEEDHLAWCAERLKELQADPSRLNPVFYGLSFGMGVLAGVAGDRVSLGFIHATEDQVVAHLDRHRESLPAADVRSRAIVERMREDESRHGQEALEAGGSAFPEPVRRLMTAVSRLMTATAYRI
ncbi:MAG: 2-polyprenyl-3-methyl-6-methoxy-1,4-benzoquinone monooxygenase [Gammaproteobacteria bacterium]|nr:MAG: 2-polyprenyl-3-methyl-6-methoxy-1,4-benzoquinone monooxygenase [Gammaproteobacteria bacterium]